jgi:hypothetical protein
MEDLRIEKLFESAARDRAREGKSFGFCLAVDVRGGLLLPDRELAATFTTDGGRPVDPREARRELLDALAKGFDVYPPCNNHDGRGHCLGHEEEVTGV